MKYVRHIGLALTTGYILFFYSERVFWSFLRADDSLFIQVMTWLVYSIFAYMFLAIIVHFKVRTVYALFLAGVAFGWIGEGIYAMTFFGIDGLTMPISFIWTGVAWHALLSVVLGWYLLQQSLVNRGYAHTLSFSALLGLFWGVWAIAWALENLPLFATSEMFILHAFATTVLLIAALFITPKLRPGTFAPARGEKIVLFAIAMAFFVLVTIPAVQFVAAILLAAFAGLYVLLKRNKTKEVVGSSTILEVFDKRASLGKYLCLLVMPFVASLVYIGFNAVGIIFPSNIAAYYVSSTVGLVFLLISAYKVSRA